MGVHEGHRERKRKQYLQSGLDSFADHEALELLLFYAIPRRNVNGLAHTLLETFGSLQGVLNASVQELEQVPGVSRNTAVLLRLVPELQRRACRKKKRERILNTPEKCGAYLLSLLGDEKREVMYQLCLDGKCKLLSAQVLSQGDMDSAHLSTRELLRNALGCGATGVVLGHNHPSGVALPSEQDCVATLRAKETLASVDIRLLDHIVVADGDFVSMAQSGYLTR